MAQGVRSTCPMPCDRRTPTPHRTPIHRKEIATMSKHEGRSDVRSVSAVAQTQTPEDSPAILSIRPAPGHPFASLSVCDQEQAREPGPSTDVAATWANLHDLAHEWGSLACTLPSIPSPASAHVFQAIGMAFLALSHEESAYAHYFLLGN